LVQGTLAAPKVSVHQGAGSVLLGLNVSDAPDQAGSIRTTAGFKMDGGFLKSYGSQTSSIGGANVTITAGDIYVRVDSGSQAGTLELGTLGTTFTMSGGVFHCGINAVGNVADEITTTGSANVTGAQITPFILQGTVDPGATYEVLEANTGITGNFTSTDASWVPSSDPISGARQLVYAP
jgi:hypothetical protein